MPASSNEHPAIDCVAASVEHLPPVEQLRALVDQASDGIFVADSSGHYTFVNQAGCQMLGFSREQIIGKSILDLIPVNDAQRLLDSKAEMLGGSTHIDEWQLLRTDGSWLPVEVSAKILPDGQWQAIVRDISERVRAERAIRDERSLLRSIFDILPVGVWIADRDGRIVLSNRAAEQIWRGARHVGPEQFGEYKAWWVETGQPIAAEEWGIARAIRRGQISRSELIRIQCFDGSFKTVINWAAPIQSDTGAITGAIAVNEDVTSLQYTQEQLRVAVRDREEILAIVAHDLRNPLTSMLLVAQTMEVHTRNVAEGSPVRAAVASIKDMACRMSGLVDDLLAVAVAQEGRSMLKLSLTTPASLVDKAARAAWPQLDARALRMDLDVVEDLPVLNVDVERMLRVFTNLLDNAAKFTTASGRILLSAEPVAAGVRFGIANSGEALSSDSLKAMFQPFWQATQSDRRGAGLGLAICRSIVEAHGGTIWAESAQGERVRMCFVVPRAPGMASSEIPEVSAQ